MSVEDPPVWQQPYEAWKQSPAPETMHAVIKTVTPAIDQHLTRMGMHNDPILRAKSRLVAADAVRKYDPAYGATLPTWVGQQMAQLHRFRRLNSQVLPLPERMQLDALKIEHARREFVDRTGQEPDQLELADEAGLAVKRIKDVQSFNKVTPSQEAVGGQMPGGSATDYMSEAIDAVYNSGDKIDRLVLEGRMGYNGAKIQPSGLLMQKTRLSPFQLSRRARRLAEKVQNMTQQLEALYAS